MKKKSCWIVLGILVFCAIASGVSWILLSKTKTRHETLSIDIAEGVSLTMVKLPSGLWVGQYEVTQDQWGAIFRTNPSEFKGPSNPVENISWEMCQEYLDELNSLPQVKDRNLSFRLLTKKEWEYACKADGTGERCRMSDGTELTEDNINKAAWTSKNSGRKTHPVGELQPNAFGLYDMLGNVWEQTGEVNDWGLGKFATPQKPHGGSWRDSAEECTARNRLWIGLNGKLDKKTYFDSTIGFRLCADELTNSVTSGGVSADDDNEQSGRTVDTEEDSEKEFSALSLSSAEQALAFRPEKRTGSSITTIDSVFGHAFGESFADQMWGTLDHGEMIAGAWIYPITPKVPFLEYSEIKAFTTAKTKRMFMVHAEYEGRRSKEVMEETRRVIESATGMNMEEEVELGRWLRILRFRNALILITNHILEQKTVLDVVRMDLMELNEAERESLFNSLTEEDEFSEGDESDDFFYDSEADLDNDNEMWR